MDLIFFVCLDYFSWCYFWMKFDSHLSFWDQSALMKPSTISLTGLVDEVRVVCQSSLYAQESTASSSTIIFNYSLYYITKCLCSRTFNVKHSHLNRNQVESQDTTLNLETKWWFHFWWGECFGSMWPFSFQFFSLHVLFYNLCIIYISQSCSHIKVSLRLKGFIRKWFPGH